jgi:hypothetical protein
MKNTTSGGIGAAIGAVIAASTIEVIRRVKKKRSTKSKSKPKSKSKARPGGKKK